MIKFPQLRALTGYVSRCGSWTWRPRHALAGLDAQLVGLIAALVLIRVLNGAISNVADPTAGSVLQFVLVSYAIICPMALMILLAVVTAGDLAPKRGWTRLAALTTTVVVASGACVLARLEVEVLLGLRPQGHFLFKLSYLWPRYAVLAGLLAIVREFYRHELAASDAARRAEREQAIAEGDATEARLQVLEARIEPHFLFNTLANVRRLYEQDGTAGRGMLTSLIHYLEVALPQLRERDSTLQREMSLVRAYLDIQRIRMGERLDARLEVPQSLAPHPLPPMLLLTLVENAIKHGLDPLPSGGVISVSASQRGAHLVVSVTDTGVGFRSAIGVGSGLANIRARLATTYGSQAHLALENNESGGATASIALPFAAASR
ncbi:MAG TPA: histidine kinase [Steroidobacteraceae bacterium]|nr:histidine kinase [Steroidobacteraceae bacterium]